MSTLDYAHRDGGAGRASTRASRSRVAAHNSLCSGHIFLAGSEAQKKKYLTPLAQGREGRLLGAHREQRGLRRRRHQDDRRARRRRLGPERVEDLHHQRPRRRHRGGHGGDRQDARARRASPPSSWSGGPRASARARRRTSSACARSDTSELVFEDCRVPAENLLGQEGNGFIDTLRILDRGRIGIAAFSLGHRPGQPRGLDDATRTGRKQFGHAIAEFQAIQFKIADMATKVERGAPPRPGAPPRCATRDGAHGRVVDGQALRERDRRSRWPWRPCRSTAATATSRTTRSSATCATRKLGTIGEGTSEVQRLVIARELLGLRGMVR